AAGLGLCKLLFGKDNLAPLPWAGMDAQVIALPLAAITAVLVSLATRPMDKAHLDRCFAGVGRKR
ncbi:MAG: hypothetical protein N2111_13730, partial [Candidatus Sumerlaeaceae bacterium]|nr:hypothetical protein [Candidatus Sumerlaeaceae bacterium]